MKLRRTPPSVHIEGNALEDALAITQLRLPLETGGIILGWRDLDRIHVDRFIEVRDPNAQRVTYERNHGAAQVALEVAKADLPPGSLLGYVGEWHTHPALQPPSRQDRKELKALGRMTAQPVAMIVIATNGARQVQAYALAASGRTIGSASIALQGES